MRGTCIDMQWTENVHSLGYVTKPLSPINPKNNCRMDFLKELVERVSGQVAQKSFGPKLFHLKSRLCHLIGLVKSPKMLSYVARIFYSILISILTLHNVFFSSKIITWDTLLIYCACFVVNQGLTLVSMDTTFGRLDHLLLKDEQAFSL